MLELAARVDGWNHAHWGGADPSRFRKALAGLHNALDRLGRDRKTVEVSASIACVINGWDKAKAGFREPEVAVGSAERIAEVVSAYANAGAQHVIGRIVAVQQGSLLATAFHPELTGDPRVHERFVEMVTAARESATAAQEVS